jgi:hypothetical protein
MEKLEAISPRLRFKYSKPEPGCYVAEAERGFFAVDDIVVHAESLGFRPPVCNCESCGSLGSWSECEFAKKVEKEANDYLNRYHRIPGHYWGRNKNADWGLWPFQQEEEDREPNTVGVVNRNSAATIRQ